MASDSWIASVPAGLILMIAGLALLGLRGTARNAVMLAAPALMLLWVWLLPEGAGRSFEWLGLELTPVRIDALSRLFATIFGIVALAGGVFAIKQERTVELASALVYAGASIGVIFAGDLITVFVFWEIMAVASTLVVLSGGRGARAAAQRYIVIHLFGGVLLMAGIAGHVGATGSTAFSVLEGDSPARWLILAGFLINAGAPPLSSWIPDAYPKANWSGSVFLSAFTTKTAVYVLIRGFAGEEVLIWVGMIMVFYGIVYALLENDIRRLIAYALVNQVGFMIVGVGIGTTEAVNGASAHATVSVVYVALLFMGAGSVLYMTGQSRLDRLGGLFRSMPLTTAATVIGGLTLSAMPLTAGFAAKSLITDAAAHEHLAIVWFLLALASVGAFLHSGLRLPWFVFFQNDSGLRPADPPISMRLGMVALSAICLLIGIFPNVLYSLLPTEVDYALYTVPHVVYQLQLLLFAALAFFLLRRFLKGSETITLDTDWLWRKAIPAARARFDRSERRLGKRARSGFRRISRSVTLLTGPGAILARGLPTGVMAFWATLLLAAYLILYYF